MARWFAILISVCMLAGLAAAQAPRPRTGPAQSIVGVWKGQAHVGTELWNMSITFRPDASYTRIFETHNNVFPESGTYKYSNGVLEVAPENGAPAAFAVTFADPNTMNFVGGGISGTLRRQQ